MKRVELCSFAPAFIAMLLALEARAQVPETLVAYPKSNGPFPVMVLGAGQGYHMRLPILEQTAAALVKEGIAVYRFDWRFYTRDPAKLEMSPGLVEETADFQAVLALVRADPKVDKTKIFLGGKSLGSLVGYRVFAADPTLKGLALITPVCHQGPIEKMYPGIEKETRPVAFILGDKDPVCPAARFSEYITLPRNAKSLQKASLTRGDHAFGYGPDATAEQKAQQAKNIEFAAGYVAEFAVQASKLPN
jgi:dienelactone hydrolase